MPPKFPRGWVMGEMWYGPLRDGAAPRCHGDNRTYTLSPVHTQPATCPLILYSPVGQVCGTVDGGR